MCLPVVAGLAGRRLALCPQHSEPRFVEWCVCGEDAAVLFRELELSMQKKVKK